MEITILSSLFCSLYSPVTLMRHLKTVRPAANTSIRLLAASDFRDYASVSKQGSYGLVKYTKAKSLIYSNDHLCSVLFKETFASEGSLHRVITSKPVRSGNGIHVVPKAKIQKRLHTLSKEKQKDILSMLPYMPAIDAQYMNGLCQ